jgi:hypothetical protein
MIASTQMRVSTARARCGTSVCAPMRRPARVAAPLRRSIPVPKEDVLSREDSLKMEKMMQCFRMADIDG